MNVQILWLDGSLSAEGARLISHAHEVRINGNLMSRDQILKCLAQPNNNNTPAFLIWVLQIGGNWLNNNSQLIRHLGGVMYQW